MTSTNLKSQRLGWYEDARGIMGNLRICEGPIDAEKYMQVLEQQEDVFFRSFYWIGVVFSVDLLMS